MKSRTAIVLAALALLLVAIHGHADPHRGLRPEEGSLNAARQQLTGQARSTDFLVDYASAHALVHGGDPYGPIAELTDAAGMRWDLEGSNTHPPTVLPLVVPLTLLSYDWAIVVWSAAMVIALIATLRLVGIPAPWAVGAGLLLAFTFPGAYGIGNLVPLIGLGVAIAWRHRNNPIWAGVGIVLAAVPKTSGLLLFVPFLLAQRYRTVVWGAVIFAAFAVAPALVDPQIWFRYFDAGATAMKVVIERPDNASVLQLAERHGIAAPLTMTMLGSVTLMVAARRRDAFWPAVWLMVAALPIAWMYSALTLVPLAAVRVRRRDPLARPAVIGAAAVMILSPPLGQTPTITYSIVVLLALAALTAGSNDTDGLWLPTAERSDSEPRRLRLTSPSTTPDPLTKPIG
ncbi:MAG TPA: glycosyltransferase family 87 protein [Acidimicrobiales bacterium]|nr:glycosyltransferase family 87 protein [Acidimicrobiales bacterium]